MGAPCVPAPRPAQSCISPAAQRIHVSPRSAAKEGSAAHHFADYVCSDGVVIQEVQLQGYASETGRSKQSSTVHRIPTCFNTMTPVPESPMRATNASVHTPSKHAMTPVRIILPACRSLPSPAAAAAITPAMTLQQPSPTIFAISDP